jgi:hypothetical protein
MVTRVIPILSFLYHVFSMRQNPEHPAPSSLAVPVIQLTPPSHAQCPHVAYQRTNPQPSTQNTFGQFTCHTATTALHPAVFMPEGSPAETLSSLPASANPSLTSTLSSIAFSDLPYQTDTPATSPAPELQPPIQSKPVPITESQGSIGWTDEGDDQLSPGEFL